VRFTGYIAYIRALILIVKLEERRPLGVGGRRISHNLYTATILFSLLFPVVSFLVTGIYFMWEVCEFWRRISSTPMQWLNHMLEFTTSFAFFASVLHVDERFVLEERGQ